MDKAFQKLVMSFLPDGVALDLGTACGDSGKRLAVERSTIEDTIIRLKLDAWRVWPDGTKSCDCVVLCKKAGCTQFVALLVELKGDDTKSAYAQLESTAAMLCKKTGLKEAGHGKAGAASAGHPCGHGGRLVALIVAPGEGNARGMWQQKLALLGKKKILLLPIRKPGHPITIDYLYKEAYAEI